MKLKELFAQVSFEALLPRLRAVADDHADILYRYREAYDRLAAMQPNSDYQGEAQVAWNGEDGGEDQWIGVFHLDDDEWKNELAKEIVVADNVHLTLEEVAAKCLWEITFHGFSPRQIEQNFRHMCDEEPPANGYEAALERLRESIWRHQTPRRLKCKRGGRHYTLYDKKHFHKLFFGGKMNRSKRKRRYRQERRRDFLKEAGRRQRIIDELTAPGSSLSSGSLDFLHGVGRCERYRYYGVDAMRPLDYIRESMGRYQEIDRTQFDQAVIVLQQPVSAPLPAEEVERFESDMRRHWGYADMRFGIQFVPDADEVCVVVLLNKNAQ